jgi:hypothetical protein
MSHVTGKTSGHAAGSKLPRWVIATRSPCLDEGLRDGQADPAVAAGD